MPLVIIWLCSASLRIQHLTGPDGVDAFACLKKVFVYINTFFIRTNHIRTLFLRLDGNKRGRWLTIWVLGLDADPFTGVMGRNV